MLMVECNHKMDSGRLKVNRICLHFFVLWTFILIIAQGLCLLLFTLRVSGREDLAAKQQLLGTSFHFDLDIVNGPNKLDYWLPFCICKISQFAA